MVEPFDSIEKWISEHGSAAILRDHVALLKSQMSAKDVETTKLNLLLKQKDAEIDKLNILLKQKHIQTNNFQNIERDKTVQGDICPYCQQPKGKLLDIRPDKHFGIMGVKIRYYKCENCGKEYDKEQSRQ
jgi:protein-arginine kinase activator protein McsA